MDQWDALDTARQLLMDETPLHRDCGALCDAACCQPDPEGKGGMLLFPGEERCYDPLPQGFEITEDPHGMGLLLTCKGTCERAERPLACRIFPLFPYVRETDGGVALAVRMDRRACVVCPLVDAGVSGMKGTFAYAVRQAAKVLLNAKPHRDYLVKLTSFIEITYTLDGGTAWFGSA